MKLEKLLRHHPFSLPSDSLYHILQEFKQNARHKVFPYNLFMRDILISHERAIKALQK